MIPERRTVRRIPSSSSGGSVCSLDTRNYCCQLLTVALVECDTSATEEILHLVPLAVANSLNLIRSVNLTDYVSVKVACVGVPVSPWRRILGAVNQGPRHALPFRLGMFRIDLGERGRYQIARGL
jgi:hypothetical protein